MLSSNYVSVEIVCMHSSRNYRKRPPGLQRSSWKHFRSTWNITCFLCQLSSTFQAVNITFVAFSVEYVFNCTSDGVRIFDGERLVSTYCLTSPADFISSEERARVEFYSDRSGASRGFSATVTFVDPPPPTTPPPPGTCPVPPGPCSNIIEVDILCNLAVGDYTCTSLRGTLIGRLTAWVTR